MQKKSLLHDLVDGWEKRLNRLGLSKREFCKRAGISYSSFVQMENPTIKLLDSIENALRKMEA